VVPPQGLDLSEPAPPGAPRLEGEGVVLRPLEPGDGPVLRAMHAEPLVARWWGAVPEGFPEHDEPGVTRFVIESEGRAAGMVQYGEEAEPDYRHAWIDIFLGAGHQGGGLGTRALRLLMRHLVEARGHHRITIDPAAENHGAVRCYEKAGFRPVGTMRASWRDPATGLWRDTLFMEYVVAPREGPARTAG